MILDPRPIAPAKKVPDATPVYFTPEQSIRKLRVLTALEQMYGYYNAD
ncbi:hypothetical protein [Cereibacter changlensis]|nr:hypothetical protein [Cereibacter changlensis]